MQAALSFTNRRCSLRPWCCCVCLLFVQELHSELKKVQGELSKYSHVNKKALDQFSNFTEQQQSLKMRLDEAEEGCECTRAAQQPFWSPANAQLVVGQLQDTGTVRG